MYCLGLVRLVEGVVAMALNQLGANSRKPRDLESVRTENGASGVFLSHEKPSTVSCST